MATPIVFPANQKQSFKQVRIARMFAVFALGAGTVKDVLFRSIMISLEKSVST